MKTMITKDFVARRGAETPLKMSRNSIEDRIIDIEANKQHYVIKIFTPADTEKQINENAKKEVLKKEKELLSPLRLQKKKKAQEKKTKPKRRPSPVDFGNMLHIDEPFSPTRGGFITSISKLDTIKGEGNRPKVLIKMISNKYSDRSSSEFTPTLSLAKYDSLKTEETGPFIQTPIHKEQWKHVALASPKFKSTFAPKIEEEIRQNALNSALGSFETPRTATAHVQRIYQSRKALLPKLKITGPNERRFNTEPQSAENVHTSPLSVINNNKVFFPKKETDYQLEEVNSARLNYDIANSPYLRKGHPRKGAKSFALRRGQEKPSIDIGKIREQNLESSKIIHKEIHPQTARVPKLSLDFKGKNFGNESYSARVLIKNNVSQRLPTHKSNKTLSHS